MSRRFWTPPEVRTLRKLYPHMKTRDVARILGCRESRINNKALALGLKKSAAYLASDASGRLTKLSAAGLNYRFKPGLTPWNKGVEWIAGGRSAETQFKAGSMPHNTLPLGSYRMEPGTGTLQQKVSNARGSASKRWRGVHELVWVAAHGPLPRGHLVVFKPGMRTTKLEEITLDRVECITRAENMRRNSYHRYPQPIPKLIQLRGALQRQINRRERANH